MPSSLCYCSRCLTMTAKKGHFCSRCGTLVEDTSISLAGRKGVAKEITITPLLPDEGLIGPLDMNCRRCRKKTLYQRAKAPARADEATIVTLNCTSCGARG